MQLKSHLTVFLIHVATRQLLRTYIEKKHYHVDKKGAEVGFVWHLDTLFQPNNILVGTSFCCRKHQSKFISKTIV